MRGESTKNISADLGIKYQTVNNILKKYYATGVIIPPKRGGRESKLSLEDRLEIIAVVEGECTLTLKETQAHLLEARGVSVSISTVNRALSSFLYTLKQVVNVPERRNSESTIQKRYDYSHMFRGLETEYNNKNFIFIDEVGFKVVSRPKRGRSLINTSAYVPVSAARSRNISVVVAMNKEGMVFRKILSKPLMARILRVFY